MRRGPKAFLLALIAGAFFMVSVASAEIIDRIVAKVNGDIITMKEINDRLKPFMKSGEVPEGQINDLRREILEHIIDSRLALQEAEKLGIRVGERDVDSAIEQIKTSNNLTEEQFTTELAKQGLSVELFRSDVRIDIVRAKLINQEIRARAAVTDVQVDKYFQEHLGEYDVRSGCRIRNILLESSDGARDKDRELKLKMASDIVEKIKGGLSFTEAAAEYSDAPNAKDGGNMGVICWEDMNESIRSVLDGLEPGQVSEPLETPQGVQIFQMVERVDADAKASAEIKQKIREKLTEQLLTDKYQEWVKGLRAKASIQVTF